MKQALWTKWIEENKRNLPEKNKKFVEEAILHSVQQNEIQFKLGEKVVSFKKLSSTSWTMSSTLLPLYGFLTPIFAGLNKLLD